MCNKLSLGATLLCPHIKLCNNLTSRYRVNDFLSLSALFCTNITGLGRFFFSKMDFGFWRLFYPPLSDTLLGLLSNLVYTLKVSLNLDFRNKCLWVCDFRIFARIPVPSPRYLITAFYFSKKECMRHFLEPSQIS